MPQISLYIDEATLQKVIKAAHQQHISVSKWVAQQIKSRVDPMYPADFKNLYGSIQDTTFVYPEQPEFSEDTSRESF